MKRPIREKLRPTEVTKVYIFFKELQTRKIIANRCGHCGVAYITLYIILGYDTVERTRSQRTVHESKKIECEIEYIMD